MPGPIPKRSDQRRYRGKHAGPELVKAPSGKPADLDEQEWPAPSADWHPVATTWYLSLASSGQSVFYEESDLAAAYYCAELMSRVIAGGYGSSGLAATVDSLMDKLLTTEGARRRARVELQRGEPEPDQGIADQLAAYKRAAGGE